MNWSRFARLAIVVVLLGVGAVAGPVGHAEECPDGATQGCWLPPFSEGGTFNNSAPDTEAESAQYPTAVSIAMLPTGKIVYWNGIEGSENLDAPIALTGDRGAAEESRTRLLNLSAYLSTGADPRATATWSNPTPESGGGGDLFCADQRHLPDGRVLAVGGTDWVDGQPEVPGTQAELLGRKNARIYNPATNTWTQAPSMNHGRWYPTMLTLPDGRMFVAGGVRRLIYNFPLFDEGTGDNVQETEVYNPATNSWTQNGPTGNKSLPLFARLHLLPNGKVLYDASGQMWGPFGQSFNELEWNVQKWYDPTTNTWADLPTFPTTVARSGVFSTLLPLRPPYDRAEILMGGGTLATSPGSYLATNITEKVSWNAGNPAAVTRETLDPMNNMRWYSQGVALPTGEVLAFSGADKDEVITPGSELPVTTPELWDPATETWTEMLDASRQRTYHNSAILLPDGSVLVGGHSPIVHSYGQDHQTVGGANNFKDPSFEIFKPPYLFRGTRPKITHAAPPKMKHSGVYPIGIKGGVKSPDLRIVLSRLPAVTHITDADQRTVEIPIVHRGDNSVAQFKLPASSSVLPPGPYYLFVIDDTGNGPVPSVAQIVQVQ